MAKQKIITRKGFQARLTSKDVNAGQDRIFVKWYTPDGCPVDDWKKFEKILEPLLDKVRAYCEDKGLILWSY